MVENVFASMIDMLTESFEHVLPCTTHDSHGSKILGISVHPTHIHCRPVHIEHEMNVFAARALLPLMVHLVKFELGRQQTPVVFRYC